MVHPARHPDFARFVIFTKQANDHTPGGIAQHTGLHPDFIGPICIETGRILIDIHKTKKKDVRERLIELGGCKLLEDAPYQWRWLQLSIGRNHGLTIRKLRLVLEEVAAQPVGKIHLNNANTLVGLREDRWDEVVAALTERSVNGIRLRPELLTAQACGGEDPRYFKPDNA